MTKREVIKNYIQDNYDCYPGYYVWKKDYFMECSWIHWACKDIMYIMALRLDDEPEVILSDYIQESKECLRLAKTAKSECIFRTAISIAEELEGLLDGIAMEADKR